MQYGQWRTFAYIFITVVLSSLLYPLIDIDAKVKKNCWCWLQQLVHSNTQKFEKAVNEHIENGSKHARDENATSEMKKKKKKSVTEKFKNEKNSIVYLIFRQIFKTRRKKKNNTNKLFMKCSSKKTLLRRFWLRGYFIHNRLTDDENERGICVWTWFYFLIRKWRKKKTNGKISHVWSHLIVEWSKIDTFNFQSFFLFVCWIKNKNFREKNEKRQKIDGKKNNYCNRSFYCPSWIMTVEIWGRKKIKLFGCFFNGWTASFNFQKQHSKLCGPLQKPVHVGHTNIHRKYFREQSVYDFSIDTKLHTKFSFAGKIHSISKAMTTATTTTTQKQKKTTSVWIQILDSHSKATIKQLL